MAEPLKKVSAKDFRVLEWVSTIPLMDDLWLRMQAQNIAVVDIAIIRPIEDRAMDEFLENDTYSADTIHTLSPLSQMWIFSLYEFLRTWLERASKLIGYSERLTCQKTQEGRLREMQVIMDTLEERSKYVKIGKPFFLEQADRAGDKAFIDAIRAYRDRIKSSLFRDVEAIRMPLAKHEIVGKNANYFAEAPGYGRISLEGSMYWQLNNADGTMEEIERRKLADSFLNIKARYEEEDEEKKGEQKDEERLSAEDMKWLDQMFGPEGIGTKQIKEAKRQKRNIVKAIKGSSAKVAIDDAADLASPKAGKRRRGRRGGRRNRRDKAVETPA